MARTPDELLQLALNTIGSVEDVVFARDLGDDRYLFRDVNTGRFAFATNVWAEYRSVLDEIGGSQGLAELGLI